MRSFTIWKQFHIAQLISSSRMTSSFFVSILSKRMKQLRLRVGFWVWAKSYSSRMMTVQNNLFIRAHAITSIYVKSTGSSSSSGKFSPLMQKWLLQGFFRAVFLCVCWCFELRAYQSKAWQSHTTLNWIEIVHIGIK